jgi:hypothetical protein
MRNVGPSFGQDLPFGNQESEDDNPPSGKRTKRCRRSEKSPGPEKVDEDGIVHDEDNTKSTKPRASKGKADDSVPLFACPLYKGDPNKYWRANGCANWAGRTIDTVLRVSLASRNRMSCSFLTLHQRHIGDTHVGVYGDIDNELYKRLKNLKPKAGTKDKQQEAEEHWKIIFRESFPTASQIPDPCTQMHI